MTDVQLAAIAAAKRLVEDLAFYAEKCLKIRPKAGGLVPLRLNRVQRAIHERLEEQRRRTGRVRAIILKARQPGCSTYISARFYHRVTTGAGLKAFILTHRDRATAALFSISRRFHDHCPSPLKQKTRAANANEIAFGALDSSIEVGTAKAEGVGRADTINLFHGSEVAFWARADEHMAGILQAIPNADGTEVILESTANGLANLFHKMWKAAERGEGPYQPIFLPWFWHEEYEEPAPEGWHPPEAFAEYADLHDLTPDQTYWAWQKNAELAISLSLSPDEICWRFRQEYPATPDEAFQAGDHESFIPANLVVKARAATAPDQTKAPLVLGVDSGRHHDRTKIIDRRGRCAGHLVDETLTGDEMEVAGKLARLIDLHKPVKVYMDVTGGYGAGAYDRLKEKGYSDIVVPVNFGAKATDDRQYANKRAEMWGLLRDWLNDPGGADIIDDDELHGDLCAPGYHFTSSDQVRLEPKDKIKARLGRSPDKGDAVALTFAERLRPARPSYALASKADSRYSPHNW